MRRLAIIICLAGCTPSPDVVNAGAGRELWNGDATKAPPTPDGDVTSVDPTGPGGSGGDSGAGGFGGDGGSAGAGGQGGTGGDPVPPSIDAGTQPMQSTDARASTPDTGTPPAQGPSGSCTLSFQVTTVTFNGDFAPHNVGAIWISDANAKFVKSLNVWGKRRLPHLVTWEKVSGGSTVDAITSATASSHSTRMGKWNCAGLDEKPVPDGMYNVNVEFTERNSEGKVMTPLSFKKSSAPVTAMPPDQSNFKSVRLQVTSP